VIEGLRHYDFLGEFAISGSESEVESEEAVVEESTR
jgi:hypothetical protein